MTKSKQVVYQDNEYVIFEDGSGGAIMSNEEIEDAEKFDEWFNSLTKEEHKFYSMLFFIFHKNNSIILI